MICPAMHLAHQYMILNSQKADPGSSSCHHQPQAKPIFSPLPFKNCHLFSAVNCSLLEGLSMAIPSLNGWHYLSSSSLLMFWTSMSLIGFYLLEKKYQFQFSDHGFTSQTRMYVGKPLDLVQHSFIHQFRSHVLIQVSIIQTLQEILRPIRSRTSIIPIVGILFTRLIFWRIITQRAIRSDLSILR